MTDANTPRTAAGREFVDSLVRDLGVSSTDEEYARQRILAIEAEAAASTPAEHRRQSLNGCVTCSRRWSEHTPEEQGAAAPTPAPAHVHGQGEICDADCPHWQWAEAAAPTPAEPDAETLALAMEADGWEFNGDPVFGAQSIIAEYARLMRERQP